MKESALKKSLLKLIKHAPHDTTYHFYSMILNVESDPDIILYLFKLMNDSDIDQLMLEKYKSSPLLELKYFCWEILIKRNPEKAKELAALYNNIQSSKEKAVLVDTLSGAAHHPDIFKFLYQLALSNTSDDLTASALKAISHYKNEKSLNIVLQHKNSPSEKIIREVICALKRLDSIVYLVQMLHLSNISESNVLLIISFIKELKDESTIPTLMKKFKNASTLVKVGIVRALSFTGPKIIDDLISEIDSFSIFYHNAFVETFTEILMNNYDETYKYIVGKFERKIMEHAIKCVEKDSSKGLVKKISNELKRDTDTPSAETEGVELAISNLPLEQKMFISELVQIKDPSTRSTAIMKLERRTNYEKIAESMSDNVAVILFQTISNLKTIDDRLKNIIYIFMFYPNHRIQSSIIDIIVKFRLYDVEKYFNHILEGDDKKLIKLALYAIGKINIRTYIALLRDKFLTSTDPSIVLQAIQTFGDMRLERTVEILIELLDTHEFAQYKIDILTSLSNIKHKLTIDVFKKHFNEGDLTTKLICARGLLRNLCEDDTHDLLNHMSDTKNFQKIISVYVEFRNLKYIEAIMNQLNNLDVPKINSLATALDKFKAPELAADKFIELYKKSFLS